ncbi:MAG: 16S rRNA (cytosine(1402)-N(4))-methyltransferase RsmH [Dehalococcoidia bacterium]
MVGTDHVPVMLQETMEALRVHPGGEYVDCTVGGAGHARAIVQGFQPGGRILGIDADPEAVNAARARLADYNHGSVIMVNDNFYNLEAICHQHNFHPVDGILFDLGLSSPQLEDGGRGFSFLREGPLDMRFNPAQDLTAGHIVNTYSEAEIAYLLKKYGEERHGRRIAHFIVTHRPLNTTQELVAVVNDAVRGRVGRIHPATRTFQALRITVNRELENMAATLRQVPGLLNEGGRLVVISYHSLEDRLVKEFLRRESTQCLCPPGTPTCICGHRAILRLVSKKVIVPSPEEVAANPRSRSARLRVAERI